MINRELKEKLETHKRWLESQIQRQEQEQKTKSPHSDDSGTYYSNDESERQDLGYYMVSVQNHEPISNYQQNNQYSDHKIMMRGEDDIINRSRRTRSDVKSAVQKGNTGSLEKDSSPGTKRWDILYMKNKKTIEQRNKLMNEKKAEEENDPECTFIPKINRKYPVDSTVSFIERSRLWKQQKDQRLNEIRKQDENKDLKGCTFQPNLYETQRHRTVRNTHHAPANFKGMDKFVRRYNIARQNKEEKELVLSNPMAKYKLEAARKADPTTAVSVAKSAQKQTARPDLREREENLIEPEDNKNRNDIAFGYAIKQLHNELLRLNMNYEQD